MKLLAKFNLMLILLFGIGLLLVSQLSRRFLENNAREQTIQQARLMVSSARSTRDYTEEELDPLLEKTPDSAERFLPQTIPFYAATVTFNHLRRDYPDYTYKEAALNPTNPRDRAEDWEADIINYFRDHPGKTELIGERNTPTGQVIYLSQPIAVAGGLPEVPQYPGDGAANRGQHLRKLERLRLEGQRGGWRADRLRADRSAVGHRPPGLSDAAAVSLSDFCCHHGRD